MRRAAGHARIRRDNIRLAEALRTANEELERRVHERTGQLETSNRELLENDKHALALRVRELVFLLSCHLGIVMAKPYSKWLRSKLTSPEESLEVLGLDRDDIDETLINLPMSAPLLQGMLDSLHG